MASTLYVDTVSEQTSGSGVTVDGVFLKDSTVTALQLHTAMAVNGAATIASGTVIFTKAGVTGGSKNLATFAAFVGATLTLQAYGLKWVVVANNNVTIS